MGRVVMPVAPLRALYASHRAPLKNDAAPAVGVPVGYSDQELATCLSRMRGARPDLLADALRRTPPFVGQPTTLPPSNLVADVLATNTATLADAQITRAVLHYADAILSPDAVPSAWPGPVLRNDGRGAPRTPAVLEAWKQRLVLALALGLASPTLRRAYAEAIMAVCRGWSTVYTTAKPSGDPSPTSRAAAPGRRVYGRDVPRAVYGRAVRPAGWTDAATTGVLRTASTIAGTASNLLRGDQQLAALEESLGAQRAALDAQMAASASRAEGATITQRLQLQMAREQREAEIASTEREILALRAQIRAIVPADATPPIAPVVPPPSTSHTGAWLLALAALAAAGVGVAVVVTRRRKTR